MAKSWPSVSAVSLSVCVCVCLCVCVCVCVCARVYVPSALFVCRPAAHTKAQRGHTHRWVNKAIVYYFVFYYVGRD